MDSFHSLVPICTVSIISQSAAIRVAIAIPTNVMKLPVHSIDGQLYMYKNLNRLHSLHRAHPHYMCSE